MRVIKKVLHEKRKTTEAHIQQLQHDNHVIKGFTVQQCLDVALIALHNEFHFGPKMSARFESAFLDTFMAYA